MDGAGRTANPTPLARRKLDAGQAKAWLWDEIRAGLLDRFRAQPATQAALARLEAAVTAGEISPTVASQQLLGEP